MAWGESVRQLAGELKNLHEEFVTTRVEFGALKERVIKSIEDFKEIVEKAADRMDQMEKEHVRERAELNAKIDGLSERLNTLSEDALHSAVKDVARDIVMQQLAGGEDKLGDSKRQSAKLDGPDNPQEGA